MYTLMRESTFKNVYFASFLVFFTNFVYYLHLCLFYFPHKNYKKLSRVFSEIDCRHCFVMQSGSFSEVKCLVWLTSATIAAVG